MLARRVTARVLAFAALLLVFAGGSQEPQSVNGGLAEELSDAELTAYILLELSSPAVRYLRAFTVPCWLPAPSMPAGSLDGSWAVALVTLWNDLTAPNNGLGRLVTAQQLHAEAAAMLGEERYNNSLAILELSVLLRLYPYQPPGQLAAWQRSMALAGVAHPRVRLQLARTLVLMARARAGAGAEGAAVAGALTNGDLELLEGAMVAGDAAMALFHMEGIRHEDGPADPSQLPQLNDRIAKQVAALLSTLSIKALRALAVDRGLRLPKGAQRRELLQELLPLIRIPLQLAEAAGKGGVVVQADDENMPRFSELEYESEWELNKAVVADVLTLLPPTLLQEVGIQCDQRGPGAGGCLSVVDGQLEAQAKELGPRGAHRKEVELLLGHADMIEEVLLRLEEVLVGSSAGVRMADGTTWLRQTGWDWHLAPFLHSRLYPSGVAVPEHDLNAATRFAASQQHPLPNGEHLCLDKTFLLDTVVRMELEALQGVQYALDNLHYAQFSAGGPERFWQLAGSQQLDIDLDAAHRAQLVQLLSSKYGAPAPAELEQILNSASNSQGSDIADQLGIHADSTSDPFIAAFISFCVLGAASLYVYGNRRSLSAVLLAGPWHIGCGAGMEAQASGRSVAQRNAATVTLREAMAAGDPKRLALAIDAAEEAGVEKLLLKKARAAAQAMRKKRTQGKQQQMSAGAPNARSLPSSSFTSSEGLSPASSDPRPPDAVPKASSGLAGRGGSGKAAASSSSSSSPASSSDSRLMRSRSEGAASLAQAAPCDVAQSGSRTTAVDGVGQRGGLSDGSALVRTCSARRGNGAAGAVAASRDVLSGTRDSSKQHQEQQEHQALAAAVQPVRTSTDQRTTGGAQAAAAVTTEAVNSGEKRERQVAVVEQAQPLAPASSRPLSRNTSNGSEPPNSPGTPMESSNPSRSTSGQESLDPPSPRPLSALGSPQYAPPSILPTSPRQPACAPAARQQPASPFPAPATAAAKGPRHSPHEGTVAPAAAAAASPEITKGQQGGVGGKVILAPRPLHSLASSGKKDRSSSPKQQAAVKAGTGAASGNLPKVMPPPPPPPPRSEPPSPAQPSPQAAAAGDAGVSSITRKVPAAVSTGGSKPTSPTQQSPSLTRAPRAAARQQRPPVPVPEATVTFVPGPADRALPQQPQQAMTPTTTPRKPLAPQGSGGAFSPATAAGRSGSKAPGSSDARFTKRSLSDTAARSRHLPANGSGPVPVVSPVRPPPPPPPRNPASTSPPGMRSHQESQDPSRHAGSIGTASACGPPSCSPNSQAGADLAAFKSWPRASTTSVPAWLQENQAASLYHHQHSPQQEDGSPVQFNPFDVQPRAAFRTTSAPAGSGSGGSSNPPSPFCATPRELRAMQQGHACSPPHVVSAPSLFVEPEGGYEYEPMLSPSSTSPSVVARRMASLLDSGTSPVSTNGPRRLQHAQSACGLFPTSTKQPAAVAGGGTAEGTAGGGERRLHSLGAGNATAAASPELLASLQQIWSGGGGGNGAQGQAAATDRSLQGPVRTLSAPHAGSHTPLEVSSDHAIAAGNGPGSNSICPPLAFDAVLSPAPELAWWHGCSVPAAAAMASAGGFGAGNLATSWPLRAAGGLEGQQGAEAEAEANHEEQDTADSMDLAQLGFTELGD